MKQRVKEMPTNPCLISIGLVMTVAVNLGFVMAEEKGNEPIWKPHQRTLSMFLDEYSSTDSMRVEDFYGLEEGKTYEMSFRMRKEPGTNQKGAFVSVLTKVTGEGVKNKPNMIDRTEAPGTKTHMLVERLGSDVPADGQWHEVKASFTTETPEGMVFKRNPNDAFQASLILYIKGSTGKAVSISGIKGVPRFPDYQYLGEKDSSLPQILLIGDSTMMHTYHEKVKAFEGIAAIHYIPVNSMHTDDSIDKYRRWVGGRKWDLIYFNSGIHDFTAPKGDNAGTAPNRIPTDRYEENLRVITSYLKSTGAKLVWRSITPIKTGIKGRAAKDVDRYNASAAKVMKEAGIPVHDVTTPNRDALLATSRDGVHFSKEGNLILATEFLKYLTENKLPGGK